MTGEPEVREEKEQVSECGYDNAFHGGQNRLGRNRRDIFSGRIKTPNEREKKKGDRSAEDVLTWWA